MNYVYTMKKEKQYINPFVTQYSYAETLYQTTIDKHNNIEELKYEFMLLILIY